MDDCGTPYFLIFVGLLVGVLFQITILGIAFFGADEVECTFLWCTFSTTRREQYLSVMESRECSVNGVPVNCSEFAATYPDTASHGFTSIAGVCPGWKDNKTIEECIEEASS